METLLKGDATPFAEFDFGSAVPDNFVFSPDGRYLYGSSYYTGASNIFRYEIATKKVEAVTNAETGFVRPIPLGNDELIVFRYTGEGFVPARIKATPLEDVSAITFSASGRREAAGAEDVKRRPDRRIRHRYDAIRKQPENAGSRAAELGDRIATGRPGLQRHAGRRASG